MRKDIIPDKGIEKTKQDKHIIASQAGIAIKREGKAISSERLGAGSVYLVVDCSGSMSGPKLDQAKRGALNFARDALAKGYSSGLIQFHSSATCLCEPQTEASVLQRALANIQIGGSTNMAEAIKLAHQRLGDRLGSRVMVVVTDGMPDSVKDALSESQEAKKKGIDIIAIGTDDADQGFLSKLASRTELGVKVAREQFEKGITSTAKMLPPARKR